MSACTCIFDSHVVLQCLTLRLETSILQFQTCLVSTRFKLVLVFIYLFKKIFWCNFWIDLVFLLCFLCSANYYISFLHQTNASVNMFFFLFFASTLDLECLECFWMLSCEFFHLFNSISIFIHWSINESHHFGSCWQGFDSFISAWIYFCFLMPHTEILRKIKKFWKNVILSWESINQVCYQPRSTS